MRVLTRTTRCVALTDAGQRLLPLTRTVLGLIDGMAGAATGDQLPQQYELVVGTRYEVGLSWLCPILGPLARKRPQRTVHLYNGSSKDLLAGLERGELDGMVASVRLSSPRLAYAALHDEEYLLVGGSAEPASPRGRAPADPGGHQSRSAAVSIFPRRAGRRRAVAFRAGRVHGGHRQRPPPAAGGEGRVGVLPTFFIKSDLAKGRLRRLMPRVRLRSDSLRLVWRAGHPREAELIALAHDLREFPLR